MQHPGKIRETGKIRESWLTLRVLRSRVRGLPRWRNGVLFCCGGAGFLRTQQRVKSQCIFCTKPPSRDVPFWGVSCYG